MFQGVLCKERCYRSVMHGSMIPHGLVDRAVRPANRRREILGICFLHFKVISAYLYVPIMGASVVC